MSEIVPAPILFLEVDPSDVEEDETDDRLVRLHGEDLWLYGRRLSPGDEVSGPFAVEPARHAWEPLTDATVRSGLVIVTTLPNIRKHACSAQLLQTESLAHTMLPKARVFHVAADDVSNWREVDALHGDSCASGYALGALPLDDAFRVAFGVGVRGSHRIARGLFALLDGVVLAAELPFQQGRTPDVPGFIGRTRRLYTCIQKGSPS
jgi:hypothetical protein